jgi:XRE family transcriptional regulator, master regulator for biofilm formation
MIGTRIKKLRNRKGYSLTELARLSDVSKSYLSQIERNLQTNPSLQFLSKVAGTLECSIEYILGGEKKAGQKNHVSFDEEWTDLLTQAIKEGMSKEDFEEYRRYCHFRSWKQQQLKKPTE